MVPLCKSIYFITFSLNSVEKQRFHCFLKWTVENSILKYKWIKRSLKHARFFGHDGAAGLFEIEQVF
jgi:hypothetical protein